MRASEKTLEINICTEIFYFHWRRHHERILFLGPSLRQEAKLGFDIKAYGKRMKPFYIQYKAGKKSSSANQAIYTINNDSNNLQHHFLKALSKSALVFYGLPLLFSMVDIEQGAWQLLKATEWVNVATMPLLPLPKLAPHSIEMDLTTRKFKIHSQERSQDDEYISFWSAYKTIEDSEPIESELVLAQNDFAIRETFQGEEIPDDAASGLIFGAMAV